jgi:hypothetical protein
MNTLTIPLPQSATPTRNRVTCNFDQICEPGAYVENRWGTLFRMPEDGLPANRHLTAKRASRERWSVTRVSRNPRISLELARKIARNLGVMTSF